MSVKLPRISDGLEALNVKPRPGEVQWLFWCCCFVGGVKVFRIEGGGFRSGVGSGR